jgi:hypothetical protein
MVGGAGEFCAAATTETKERIETREISLKSLFTYSPLRPTESR